MNTTKENKYQSIIYGNCDNCYPNHNKQVFGEIFYENGVWSFSCLTCRFITYNKERCQMIKTKEKHAATPKLRFQTDANGENTKVINSKSSGLICTASTEENAAFIVRACNAHDALVEAAKQFLSAAPSDCYDIGYQAAKQKLETALAKAGE